MMQDCVYGILNDTDADICSQHLAAAGPNIEILRDFLAQGASVHLRNRSGHTPLYMAAAAGLRQNVEVLLEAGAHLHTDETAAAKLHASTEGDGHAAVWRLITG
jgi:lysophospholipase